MLEPVKGVVRRVPWEAFSSPVVRKGLFFTRLEFTANNQKESISWLSKSTSKALRESLFSRLLEMQSASATAVLQRIHNLVKKAGYLRSSHAAAIAQFAESQRHRLILPPKDIEFPENLVHPYKRLRQWAESDPALIEHARDNFLRDELERFRGLFDSVESNPLTAKQREACVIDEDNNLVLAGAGTGKTSTMIGRAAYLLARISHDGIKESG